MIPQPVTPARHKSPPIRVTMRARSPHEPHRTATPLELLFDLVFVVAIAQAAAAFHHSITERHALEGLVGFLMSFFGIWWAWMNFTWFASAYDCDDVQYRVMVFVQITGALIFAGGVRQLSETHDMNLGTIVGYMVMRLAQVGQWIRAGVSDPNHRRTAFRYAIGVTLCQVAWVGAFLGPPSWAVPAFVIFGAAEMLVPVWAERAGVTTWHPHHITERYGLLTIIVLGESILAATMAVQSAL
jgi:low temperature requirement protein LtrA